MDNRNKDQNKIDLDKNIAAIDLENPPIETPTVDPLDAPTPEEIAEEEANKDPDPEPTPPAPPTPPAEPEVIPPVTPPASVVPPVTPEKAGDGQDYHDLYKSSSREAIVLAERNKLMTQRVKEAGELPEPTDEEMKQEYSQWDDMTEFEKKSAKKATLADRRFAVVQSVVQASEKIDDWIKKVDEFLDDETSKTTFPQLGGREGEFRRFALAPNKRGIDMSILIKAFLHDVKDVPERKGNLLLGKAGGGAAPVAKKALDDADEIKAMRENNPRLYQRMLKEGKIKIVV